MLDYPRGSVRLMECHCQSLWHCEAKRAGFECASSIKCLHVQNQCTFVCTFIFYKDLCIHLLISLHKEAIMAKGAYHGNYLGGTASGAEEVRVLAHAKNQDLPRGTTNLAANSHFLQANAA